MGGEGVNVRYDWPIDSGPATNVNRREVVCVPSEVTVHAFEGRLRGSVAFVDMSATRALATSVLRVNVFDGNTSELCFVL